MDIRLDEEGFGRRRIFVGFLKTVISAQYVYCSDLSRSGQTAEIIAASKNLAVIPRENFPFIHGFG